MSWWINNRNCQEKLAIDSKVQWVLSSWEIYHLVATLVRVCWNNLSLVESSIILLEGYQIWEYVISLDEYSPTYPLNLGISKGSLVGLIGQIWKDIMWLDEYYPTHPSNLGMCKGSLVGLIGQEISCWIGSSIYSSNLEDATQPYLGGCEYGLDWDQVQPLGKMELLMNLSQ